MILNSTLTIGILAILLDLAVPTILAKYYPGYKHLYDTISTLGTKISPVKKYQNFNFIIVGILFVLFGFLQQVLLLNLSFLQLFYSIGIIAFGIGTVLAGYFPEDEINTEESLSGKIHGISSGIGFLLLILNPLWAFIFIKSVGLQFLNLLVFIMSIIFFIAFIISKNKKTGFLKYTGLYQRLVLLLLYSSLFVNYIVLINHKTIL